MSTNPIVPTNLNISIDSPPVTKLIETVGNGIGAIFAPGQYLRLEKKKGEAKVELAKAEIEALRVRITGLLDLEDELSERLSQRIVLQEYRRQMNLDSIVGMSIDQLPEIVNDDPVDEDWTVKFLNFAQDVGDEDMQKIWAKLLAGEVAEPGTFSLRTLQTISLLSYDDAKMFSNLCSYLLIFDKDSPIEPGIPVLPDLMRPYLFNKKTLSIFELKHLETISLINRGLVFKFPNDLSINFYYGKSNYVMAAYSQYIQFTVAVLTQIGKEIMNLCTPEEDTKYINAMIEIFEVEKIRIRKADQQ